MRIENRQPQQQTQSFFKLRIGGFSVTNAGSVVSPRPRIRDLYRDLLLAHFRRIARRQRLEAVPNVIDHVEIAVWTEGISQPHIRADRLDLRRVSLSECRQVHKAIEGVTEFQPGQIDIEIALCQSE